MNNFTSNCGTLRTSCDTDKRWRQNWPIVSWFLKPTLHLEENQPPRYWHCLAAPRLFHLKGSVKDQAPHIGVRDEIYLFINIFIIRFQFVCLFFIFLIHCSFSVLCFCPFVSLITSMWRLPVGQKDFKEKSACFLFYKTEKCVGVGLFTQLSVTCIYLLSLIILINPPTPILYHMTKPRGRHCLNL